MHHLHSWHLTDDSLDWAIQNSPESVIRYDASIRETERKHVLRLSDTTHRIKTNAFDIFDGSIIVRNSDALIRRDFSPVSRQGIRKFIQLRDTLRVLYDAQLPVPSRWAEATPGIEPLSSPTGFGSLTRCAL